MKVTMRSTLALFTFLCLPFQNKEYENLLQNQGFFRIHQSYLVNLKEVDKLVRAEGGYLLLKNGVQLPISRSRRETFPKEISQIGINFQ